MRTFDISTPDRAIEPLLRDKIDNLTKPKGALGRLEELALQVGLVQQTLCPTLRVPQNIIFCADHGIADEGVSVSPKEVTWQQTVHFTHGGGGVNFLCDQHGFRLNVVDAGVDHDLPYECGIVDMSVGRGTRNFLHGAAMTRGQMDLCIGRGAQMVRRCEAEGSNVLSFGEMGIGNTSPSSMWMHRLTGIPLDKCIGAGSGLDSEGIRHKYSVLKAADDNYRGDGSVEDILCRFGGFEMLMAVGAMLQAAEDHVLILVDGFIMTACMLAAERLYPAVRDYAVFCHCGDESGHRLLLDAMGAKPLLSLGLRLGEGTGAICAYPIVRSAVLMINEMESFGQASVTKYF